MNRATNQNRNGGVLRPGLKNQPTSIKTLEQRAPSVKDMRKGKYKISTKSGLTQRDGAILTWNLPAGGERIAKEIESDQR